MVKPGTLHTSHEVLMERNHAAAGNPSTHELNLSKQKDTEHTNAGHDQGGAEHVGHDTKPTIGYYIPRISRYRIINWFSSIVFATTLHFLSKAPLVAKNDPFYEESLHHHV